MSQNTNSKKQRPLSAYSLYMLQFARPAESQTPAPAAPSAPAPSAPAPSAPAPSAPAPAPTASESNVAVQVMPQQPPPTAEQPGK